MRILSFDLGDFNAESAWRLLDEDTGETAAGTVTTVADQLDDLVRWIAPTVVLCEACTMTAMLRDVVQAALDDCAFHAANTNADAWKWTNTKTKTDAKDCERLIRLFRVGELATVFIPDRRDRTFRRTIMHRGKLVERRASAYNGIRAACKRHQVALPKGEAAWSEGGLAELDRLVEPIAGSSALLDFDDSQTWLLEISHLLAQIRLLNDQIKQLDALIAQELERRPEAQLLQSAPGIGPQLAAVMLAFIGNPRRFANGKRLAAYAGLVPRVYQSGQTERMGHITKAGNVRLRKLLINAAWIAVRFNPWAKALFERLTGGSRHRARRKIAIVAVARRLLIRCWAMMRDGAVWKASTVAASA